MRRLARAEPAHHYKYMVDPRPSPIPVPRTKAVPWPQADTPARFPASILPCDEAGGLTRDETQYLQQPPPTQPPPTQQPPLSVAGHAYALTNADDPLDVAKVRAFTWLTAHGLQPAVSEAEKRAQRLHGDEDEVAVIAGQAVDQMIELALEATVFNDELFDEEILESASSANAVRRRGAATAAAKLAAAGVGAEYLTTSSIHEWLPLLQEMTFARAVGGSQTAQRLRPLATSFGTQYQWPKETRHPPEPHMPVAMVLVMRREGEDLSWLAHLPERVDYHVMTRRDPQPAKADET